MAGAEPPQPSVEELFEHAPCGLLLTTKTGLIQRANTTFCEWLGHPREALVDKRRLQDLLTVGGRIFHQTHWAPLLHMQGSIAEVKLDLLHRDGQTIPMIMNAIRRDDAGQVRHEIAVFVAEDRHKYERELLLARERAEELLAQREAAQQALLAAQAELSREHALARDRALFAEQMVGIVSHDLRNPLAAIKMGSQLLGMTALVDSQKNVVRRIDSSTERALRLINVLLDFTQARIGQGLVVSRAPIALHDTVADCLAELSTAYPARRLDHRREGHGECVADPDRLIQLIGNLVGNAMSYGSVDRPVTVTSAILEDVFEIRVHNFGPAIPPHLLPTLFEPMVRGASGKSARGVGLGLYIVREIARAHGGTVTGESSSEAGTTFTLRAPRRPQ